MTADLKEDAPELARNSTRVGVPLFVGGMLVAIGLQPAPGTSAFYAVGYALVGFHLALFPLVAALVAPPWAKAAAYGWLIGDIALNAAAFNPAVAGSAGAAEMIAGLRYGLHISAALWIVAASREAKVPRLRGVGLLAGVALGGFSFIYPWAPQPAFLPALVLLPVWLLMAAASLPHAGPAKAGASPPAGHEAG